MVIFVGCYFELANGSFLLNQVGDAKSVTIFGCTFCANQSIAYAKDILSSGNNRSSVNGSKATAPQKKQGTFGKNGTTAQIRFFNLPTSPYCQLNQSEQNKVAKACGDSQAANCRGLHRNKKRPPISLESFLGCRLWAQLPHTSPLENGRVLLGKAKTKVIRFNKQADQTIRE